MSDFTKKDLKPGMIVELRIGWLAMIHELNNKLVLIEEKYGYDLLDRYAENLLFRSRHLSDYDIMKVRKPNRLEQFRDAHWHEAPIIWERKELPKLTNIEKTLLDNAMIYDKKASWIARDKNENLLCLYTSKPEKYDEDEGVWSYSQGTHARFDIFNHLFQFVKWEDEEPWYIPDLLEENEN